MFRRVCLRIGAWISGIQPAIIMRTTTVSSTTTTNHSDYTTAAAVAVAVAIALRRPLGSGSAGCALDLFGRLVAQKEESPVEAATQIPGKP
jgi:hypothetical protein